MIKNRQGKLVAGGVIIVVLSLLLIMTLACAPKPAEKIILKTGSSWPIDHWQTLFLKSAWDEVNEKAAGQLEIQWAGGPELVPGPGQVDAVGEGVIDIGQGPSFYYSNLVPEQLICDLPMVWTAQNFSHCFRTSGIYEVVDKAYQERANVKILGITGAASMSLFTSKVGVTKMEDLKGLKLRGGGGSTSLDIAALGATDVTLASEEIYSAAERGIIEGGIRPPAAVMFWGEYEVWHFMVRQPLSHAPCFAFVNLDKWNSLPSDLRELMAETFLRAEERLCGTEMPELEAKDIGTMQDKYGLEVTELTSDEWARWVAVMEPVLADWLAEKVGPKGQDLLDMLETYGKEH